MKKRSHFRLVIFVGILSIVLLLMFTQKKSVQQLQSSSSVPSVHQPMYSEKLVAQPWPLKPTLQQNLPKTGARPQLANPWPFLDSSIPVNLTVDQINGNPQWSRIFSQRIGYLINEHPDSRISRDFKSAVFTSRHIRIVLTELPPFTSAAFAVDRGVPIFAVQPVAVLRGKSTEEILELMLYIFHESVHYRYWFEAPKVRTRFFTYELDLHRLPPPDDEHCAVIWETERQAYYQTCELVVSWDLISTTDTILCERMAMPNEFEHALWMVLSSSAVKENHVKQQCIGIWAKLAGHPNPWAFDP